MKPTSHASVVAGSLPAPAVALAARKARMASPDAPSFSVSTGSKPAVRKLTILRTVDQAQAVALRRQRQPSAATSHQARAIQDRFHFLLGLGLIIAGVVAGVLLGGWLGFGVGALIVLLGDYFLILGVGGKHAWLEIFQEFFNL